MQERELTVPAAMMLAGHTAEQDLSEYRRLIANPQLLTSRQWRMLSNVGWCVTLLTMIAGLATAVWNQLSWASDHNNPGRWQVNPSEATALNVSAMACTAVFWLWLISGLRQKYALVQVSAGRHCLHSVSSIPKALPMQAALALGLRNTQIKLEGMIVLQMLGMTAFCFIYGWASARLSAVSSVRDANTNWRTYAAQQLHDLRYCSAKELATLLLGWQLAACILPPILNALDWDLTGAQYGPRVNSNTANVAKLLVAVYEFLIGGNVARQLVTQASPLNRRAGYAMLAKAGLLLPTAYYLAEAAGVFMQYHYNVAGRALTACRAITFAVSTGSMAALSQLAVQPRPSQSPRPGN